MHVNNVMYNNCEHCNMFTVTTDHNNWYWHIIMLLHYYLFTTYWACSTL